MPNAFEHGGGTANINCKYDISMVPMQNSSSRSLSVAENLVPLVQLKDFGIQVFSPKIKNVVDGIAPRFSEKLVSISKSS